MLRRLSISNYVLIESLELELPEGLIIITGETGAGKSILLGAVSLLLGTRADVSILGDKTRNCVVEAEFSTQQSPLLKALFEQSGIDFSNEIILRRVVSPSGRSRSFLNDEPVNVQFLSAISASLIDIHSQHQHLRLADPRYRLGVVDSYARNQQLLDSYMSTYRKLHSVEVKATSLKEEIALARRDRDFRQFQHEELCKASLSACEMQRLEQEQSCLAHAEELQGLLGEGICVLDGEDYSAVSSLKQAQKLVDKASLRMSSLSALAQRLDSCRIELSDIVSELSDALDKVEVSPQRLETLEQRLSFLWGLMNKYNCSSEQELITKRDVLGESLNDDTASEERLNELLAQMQVLEEKVASLSTSLHQRRSAVCGEFSARMQDMIRSLEMTKAVFNVELSDSSASITGNDDAHFMFSSSGSALAELGSTASGGELSRVMLCLKAILSECTPMATMIFDEIDTGVSGSVADKMGKLLGSMGDNMQIIAITHLPQVAAKGMAHLCVRKSFTADDKAVTKVEFLDEKERVAEIARLLSGEKVTKAAMDNARELISQS